MIQRVLDETADKQSGFQRANYYTSSRTLLRLPIKMRISLDARNASSAGPHPVKVSRRAASPASVLFLESAGRLRPRAAHGAVRARPRAGARSRGRPPHLAFTLVRGCLFRFFESVKRWVVAASAEPRRPFSRLFFRMPSTMPDGQSGLRAREHDRPEGVRDRQHRACRRASGRGCFNGGQ
jgi:hypothetical protein